MLAKSQISSVYFILVKEPEEDTVSTGQQG